VARYLSVHLQDGRHAGGTLLSPAAMHELHRPVSRLNEHWSYAMGWLSGTVGGRPVLWHSGLVPNFYAFMALVRRSPTHDDPRMVESRVVAWNRDMEILDR
jgi:hypothetical protein